MEDIIIAQNETKQKLVDAINASGLPAFVLNYIIKEIQTQLEKLEQEQLQEALKMKEEKQKKDEEKEVKDEQD